MRKTAADDPSLLMGAAILAEGSLSRDIQRECIKRFLETEKYFLAHELNELEIEKKSLDRIRSLAGRLTEIDKENSLGHITWRRWRSKMTNGTGLTDAFR